MIKIDRIIQKKPYSRTTMENKIWRPTEPNLYWEVDQSQWSSYHILNSRTQQQ